MVCVKSQNCKLRIPSGSSTAYGWPKYPYQYTLCVTLGNMFLPMVRISQPSAQFRTVLACLLPPEYGQVNASWNKEPINYCLTKEPTKRNTRFSWIFPMAYSKSMLKRNVYKLSPYFRSFVMGKRKSGLKLDGICHLLTQVDNINLLGGRVNIVGNIQ